MATPRQRLGSHLEIDASHETTFDSELDTDSLSKCWWEMQNELKRHGIEEEQQYEIELGIRRYKTSFFGDHNTVIIRVRQTNMTFRLDLILDSDSTSSDNIGLHTCPNMDCNWKTGSYREYNKHYLRHFGNGESIIHNCCDREYSEYVLFLKHLYEKHRSNNPIGINFVRIDESDEEEGEGAETMYFPSGVNTMTFHELLKNALLLLKNYGKYFIFFWNCEDYATWFLVFHGVPLSEIEPTLTDRSSSTTSSPPGSPGVIDTKKRWHTWDTTRNLEIDEELGDYASGYTCDQEECKYFPPMSRGELKKHIIAAHYKTQEELNRQIHRKLLGCQLNDVVSPRDIVRYTLYRETKTELNAGSRETRNEESLILQPWSTNEVPTRRDHFCRIHGQVNEEERDGEQYREKLEVVKLTQDEVDALEYVVDFDINLATLYELYYAEAIEFTSDGPSNASGSECVIL